MFLYNSCQKVSNIFPKMSNYSFRAQGWWCVSSHSIAFHVFECHTRRSWIDVKCVRSRRSQVLPENVIKFIAGLWLVYLCPTWSVWALQLGSAGSRGPVPRRAPPEYGCRRPRWCSCPEAPSTRSLMPCFPGAPGARSLTLSVGKHMFLFLKNIIFHRIAGKWQRG